MKSYVYQKALKPFFVCFFFYENAGRQVKILIILISFVFLCKFRTSSSEELNPGIP